MENLEHMLQRAEAIVQGPSGSMGDLEEEIVETSRSIQREILQKASQARADATPPQCPRCGRALTRVTHGHERTVESRFGSITIGRLHGYCPRCEQWFHPADFALGLEKNAGASPSVQEAAALAVSKMPVADAQAVLKRLAGLEVPRATLEREARRQGERALEAREREDEKACDTKGRWEVTAAIKKDLPPKPFTLVIEIDAWNIRERDAWGQSEALRAAGAEVPSRWHWVYGATVFLLAQRGKKEDSGRPVIASRGYVMTLGGVEALARQVYGEAVRRGLLLAQHVLLIADGGVWIWKLACEKFPRAAKRLDFYHASEHLWAVANEIHGAGTAAAKAWVEPLLHQLRHGGEAGVVQTLADLTGVVEETHRAAVEREAAYFASHKDHLDYQNGADKGEPIGSGAMESTCRQYQCRFKRPGQFWSEQGAEGLIALETFWRNGRWHLLYPHAGMTDPAKN
jgi:hypothetical protein